MGSSPFREAGERPIAPKSLDPDEEIKLTLTLADRLTIGQRIYFVANIIATAVLLAVAARAPGALLVAAYVGVNWIPYAVTRWRARRRLEALRQQGFAVDSIDAAIAESVAMMKGTSGNRNANASSEGRSPLAEERVRVAIDPVADPSSEPREDELVASDTAAELREARSHTN